MGDEEQEEVKTKQLSIRIDKNLFRRVNEAVQEQGFKNRTDFIEFSLMKSLSPEGDILMINESNAVDVVSHGAREMFESGKQLKDVYQIVRDEQRAYKNRQKIKEEYK